MCKLEKIRSFFDQRWSESYEWKAIHTHCLWKGQLTCSLDNCLEILLLNLIAELALRVSLPLQTSLLAEQKKFYYTTLLLKRTSDIKLPISKASLSLALLICVVGDTKHKVIKSTQDIQYCRNTTLSTCNLNKALKSYWLVTWIRMGLAGQNTVIAKYGTHFKMHSTDCTLQILYRDSWPSPSVSLK